MAATQEKDPLNQFMYSLKAPETKRQWPRRLKVLFDFVYYIYWLEFSSNVGNIPGISGAKILQLYHVILQLDIPSEHLDLAKRRIKYNNPTTNELLKIQNDSGLADSIDR
jgi:hypothetical protein